MEYNKYVEISKSYLFAQLRRKEISKTEGFKPNLLPFITISREAGTGETQITQMLLERLSKNQTPDECPWTVYDKNLIRKVQEDFSVSSLEAMLPEKKFSDIQTMFEELFGLHPTKREIVHNINKSILNLAEMGNAIIIGRGAFYITRHHKNGLHVRLIGPLSKRVKHMVENYGFTLKEAENYIKTEDQQRYDYVKKLFGIDLNDPHFYDIVINIDRFSAEEISALIAHQVEILKEKLAYNYNSEEITAI